MQSDMKLIQQKLRYYIVLLEEIKKQNSFILSYEETKNLYCQM